MSHGGKIRDIDCYAKMHPFFRLSDINELTGVSLRNISDGSPFTVSLLATDYLVYISSTFGGTISLPIVTTLATGHTVMIKNGAGSAVITIDTPGTELIDNSATFLMQDPYESVTFILRRISGELDCWIVI